MGDEVRVRLSRVDLTQRQIDFELLDPGAAATRGTVRAPRVGGAQSRSRRGGGAGDGSSRRAAGSGSGGGGGRGGGRRSGGGGGGRGRGGGGGGGGGTARGRWRGWGGLEPGGSWQWRGWAWWAQLTARVDRRWLTRSAISSMASTPSAPSSTRRPSGCWNCGWPSPAMMPVRGT